jgi:aspartate racemase
MKTIGLVGGITWESSAAYYQLINELVKSELGGYHSAKCVINSVDFAEIERAQHTGNWEQVANIIIKACQQLEAAGVDVLLICTNTIHKIADEVEVNIQVPLLHIADATATSILAQGISKVGLLGTTFTVGEAFYKERLHAFGLDVVVPNHTDQEVLNHIIFQELCFGKVTKSSKEIYLKAIDHLQKQGAEAIILGCTEIGFIIKQEDVSIPIFDTVECHARAAVQFALKD